MNKEKMARLKIGIHSFPLFKYTHLVGVICKRLRTKEKCGTKQNRKTIQNILLRTNRIRYIINRNAEIGKDIVYQMNHNIKIMADSTCDLSEELIKKYDISIVPLCIVMNDVSYFDGIEVTPEQIFAWADKNKTTPKTAAITLENAIHLIEPFVKEEKDIIFIGISGQMSSTCNVLRMLGEELEYDRIHVIDSMNLSTGIGLQVLKAAEMAEQGIPAEQITAELTGSREKVRASFIIDTLVYLSRGGRCSAVTALLANTLKLKPMIIVKNGAMGVGKKYRGNLPNVLMKYAKDLEADMLEASPERVFITHSGCEQKILDMIEEYLKGLDYFKEIHITRAGGVISSHCGPNTLGILFYMK